MASCRSSIDAGTLASRNMESLSTSEKDFGEIKRTSRKSIKTQGDRWRMFFTIHINDIRILEINMLVKPVDKQHNTYLGLFPTGKHGLFTIAVIVFSGNVQITEDQQDIKILLQ